MGTVIGGDIKEGTIIYDDLRTSNMVGLSFEYLKGNISSVEMVTEANKKKFIGAAGWGLVGLAALGPVGALAGVLVGGNKKEVCFACYLKDGRKILVKADAGLYQKIVADSMSNSAPVATAPMLQAQRDKKAYDANVALRKRIEEARVKAAERAIMLPSEIRADNIKQRNELIKNLGQCIVYLCLFALTGYFFYAVSR